MSKDQILKAALQLDPEDRRVIGEELLASVDNETVDESDDGLTPEQREELLRRLEEHRRNPAAGHTLEEVRAHIQQRRAERKAHAR